MGNELKKHMKNAEKTGVLQLSNIGLSEFPKDLFQIATVLRNLDLSNNKLGSIPPTIAKFSNLKTLTISQARLTSIPDEIGALKKLESINFSSNSLNVLPSSFSQLVNLRTVNLSKNNISSFPPVFTTMKRLEVLDLSHNKITEVPDFISQIAVHEINLNQNQITALSEGIADCQRLKVLRLQENCLQLNAIPDRILVESQISLLALEGNLFELKELHEREGYEKYMERFTATKKKLY